jgi:TRAP-type mannitol/chloroaromatic compound transport system permease large subunit
MVLLKPPFGFALFYLKGAAGDIITMREIYRGVVPFVVLQVTVLAILVWQPDIVMWLPNKVLSP